MSQQIISHCVTICWEKEQNHECGRGGKEEEPHAYKLRVRYVVYAKGIYLAEFMGEPRFS